VGNLTTKIESATNLPHSPSARLCSCMMETLHCISNQTDIHNKSILDKYCKNPFNSTLCAGVKNNYTSGVYGTYTGCKTRERQSWILNQLFISNGRDTSICSSATGIIQTPIPVQARDPDCEVFLRQAGTSATGSVTFTPTNAQRNNSPLSRTLNTGSRVGIAIGTIGFILLLFILAIGIHIRLKRRTSVSSPMDILSGKPELQDTSQNPVPRPTPFELGSSERHELEGTTAYEVAGESIVEIGSRTQIQELSARSDEIIELHSEK
jgi:1,3-beta-glucanosyltransferase GAS1